MILQSTLKSTAPNCPSFSSTLSHSLYFPSGSAFLYPLRLPRGRVHCSIKCSSSTSQSQVWSDGTAYYERRPMLKWYVIYRRISNPAAPGVAAVLDQIEKEGKRLAKWDLISVIKRLRLFKRYKQALQVYEWMNNGTERFRLSGSDSAILLDLITKVHGVSKAEDYFRRIPDRLKDERIYGALLNAYAQAKVKDKAEALMVRMRNKGYANDPLQFNVMMILYRKLNEFDKVEGLVSEMRNKGVTVNSCSYNIWLYSRGSQGSVEGMEDVFRQMLSDSSVDPDWITFCTMAAFYIKFGQYKKAEEFLKYLELKMPRSRRPYRYLIRLYGNLGNKEEVYRIWNMYKSHFQGISNWGYYVVIFSLFRLNDIEGAEKIYEEWVSKVGYDTRIGNLLMSWCAKVGSFDKIKGFFDHMVKAGGKQNSTSWEIFGAAHVKEGRISEALACFKEAALCNGADKWKPKGTNMSAFLDLCEKEADAGSREIFVGLLRELRLLS